MNDSSSLELWFVLAQPLDHEVPVHDIFCVIAAKLRERDPA
jgi:hypothetical protein